MSMKQLKFSTKLVFITIFLAHVAFATKMKLARMTPAERKQILDDARAYDQRNKQRKTETCKKGEPKCESEKTESPQTAPNENPPKPSQEKKQNL